MEYKIRVKTVAAQRFAAVRTITSRAALGGALQAALEHVWSYLNRLESVTVGPAIVRYHRCEQEMLEVEAGFPVVEEIADHARVQIVNLPGGPAATTLHEGDYVGLPAAFEAVRRWVADAGRTIAAPPYEIYWVDMSQTQNPADLRTEVVFPLTAP